MSSYDGSQIVSPNVEGAGASSQSFRDILAGGLAGYIDLELAERAAAPDRAEVAYVEQPTRPVSAAGDILRNLTPLQLGGLAVAAALSFALVTGRFR